eukprot:366331-Chlamydomonas_euryale.AAC.12
MGVDAEIKSSLLSSSRILSVTFVKSSPVRQHPLRQISVLPFARALCFTRGDNLAKQLLGDHAWQPGRP